MLKGRMAETLFEEMMKAGRKGKQKELSDTIIQYEQAVLGIFWVSWVLGNTGTFDPRLVRGAVAFVVSLVFIFCSCFAASFAEGRRWAQQRFERRADGGAEGRRGKDRKSVV